MVSRAAPEVVVTCEHGGNAIPARYRRLFAGKSAVLASHRGYDPGALDLARALAQACDAPLVASTTSRLLVELNRSAHHPQLFSEFTRGLPHEVKARLLRSYYLPYRARVEREVRARIASGRCVLHISAHTFTPVLDGQRRNADVGLLYDPQHSEERRFCERWSEMLAARIAPLRVRRNYPYRGYADGLTTALRPCFSAADYLGIEIEVNQKHPLNGGSGWQALRAHLVQSVLAMLAEEAAARHSSASVRKQPLQQAVA